MNKIKDYIRKNLVFVSLLCVITAILIVLIGYLIVNSERPTSVITPPPITGLPQEENAVITSFEGEFGNDEQVRLSWSITPNKAVITSVKLYYNGTQLGGEMKALNSYSFLQSLYLFSTGNTTFTIKVTTENGEVIEKDVVVFINYVYGASMRTEKVEDGVNIILSYEYDKENTVGVPRIHLSNMNSQPFETFYMETKKTEVGNHVRCESIYKIGTNNVSIGTHNIHLRWIFDGLNTSYDYDLEIIK